MCPVASAVKISVLSGEKATLVSGLACAVSKWIKRASSLVYSFISPDSVPTRVSCESGLIEKVLTKSSVVSWASTRFVWSDQIVTCLSAPKVNSSSLE